MNYNASIRWHSGMTLSSQVFSQLQSDITLRQQIAIRLAMSAGRYGIIPDTPLSLNGVFVRRTYEMTGVRCTVVLPSGKLLSVDADLKLPINISNVDGSYYVALEFGSNVLEYERDGVPYSQPEVILSLLTLEELEEHDAMPIKHFVVKEGTLMPDDSYIPPMLDCASDVRITECVSDIAQSVRSLAEHRNMDTDECHRALLHYVFSLANFNMHRNMTELISLLEELVNALDYYIVEYFGHQVDSIPSAVMAEKDSQMREPHQADIRPFFEWIVRYADTLSLIMDKVEKEKPTIDIEAIKKDIHDSLYAELSDKLFIELSEKLRLQLSEELPPAIIDKVEQYIKDNTEPELQSKLFSALRTPIYDDLYEALMKIIQDMLANIELKQPESFVPLI